MNVSFELTRQRAVVYCALNFLCGAIVLVLTHFQMYTLAYSTWMMYTIVVLFWIVVPLLTYLTLFRKIFIHLAMAALNIVTFLVFLAYIGGYTPFVFLWAIVIVLTNIHSGKLLAGLSSLMLFVEIGISIYFYRDQIGSALVILTILSYIVAVSTIALSFYFVRTIIKVRDRTRLLSESRQAEEVQLNRLNTLLNSISDTVLTINQYGRITSQNSAALSFFDTNQTLVGKSIDTVLKVKDEKSSAVSVRELSRSLHGTVVRDDIVMNDSTGDSLMRLSIQLSPIHGKFGADDSGCVVIIRDITRQKTLEDEKDEFISVTSHELRTPIAIAEGSLSNLSFMFDKEAKPEVIKASIDMAHNQILYLGRMINDLSTLSRAERGVGDAVEDIDVSALVQDLYQRYTPEAEQKSLKLDLDVHKLPHVTTSRLYLEEILQNFITNAIKYSKEGTITLAAKFEDGRVVFSVKDNGIGISKSDQEKIFDKFFRSEDYRTRETSGTGLGLYVVRKLASKLNTKIKVESRINHGSFFSLSLPPAVIAADES